MKIQPNVKETNLLVEMPSHRAYLELMIFKVEETTKGQAHEYYCNKCKSIRSI